MFGAHAIEHGSTRPGRWLRERRLRLTYWIAAVEGDKVRRSANADVAGTFEEEANG